MPLTAACGIIGALSISGFPLTSGFTTKTLISEAAKSNGLVMLYFLLAAARDRRSALQGVSQEDEVARVSARRFALRVLRDSLTGRPPQRTRVPRCRRVRFSLERAPGRARTSAW
jgi:hypothetical protein